MAYILNDNLYPGADYRVTFPRVTGAQIVTLTGATGGTFTLSYRGQLTAALAYNATAGQVQSALEVLSGLGPGTVTVTGSAGGPWTVAPNRPLDPNTFMTPRLGYNTTLLTGTTPSCAVTLQAKDTTGFTYFLQARSNPPLPATANIRIDATHTTQGSFTNHNTTGLIDLIILGTQIELLDFTYGSPANTNAQAAYDILEFDGTYYTLFVTGIYTLMPKVYQ